MVSTWADGASHPSHSSKSERERERERESPWGSYWAHRHIGEKPNLNVAGVCQEVLADVAGAPLDLVGASTLLLADP
jgi:hypothetical protein